MEHRPDLQVDPVCEMPIEPDRAYARLEWRGVTYYFCSAECAEQFQIEPGVFAEPGRPGPAPHVS